MKKIFLYSLIITAQFVTAQDRSVEKSIFNVQSGLFGFWLNNESRLSEETVLRSEIGLNFAYYTGYSAKNKFSAAAIFTIEPRWYYNLGIRYDKDKNISNNSGNFIGLKLDYTPNWFTVSNIDNFEIANQVAIIPEWGWRNSIGNSNFNYEFGGGIGYKYVFLKERGYAENDSKITFDIRVRIGYTF